MDKYCKTKSNVLYERDKFYRRMQKPDEPFEIFYRDIKKLVNSCEFNDSEEGMIRDKLVFGSNNTALKEWFINIGDPSCEDVITKSKTTEMTKNIKQEMPGQNTIVHQISSGSKFGTNSKNNFNWRENNETEKEDKIFFNDNKFNITNKSETFLKSINCHSCRTWHRLRECPAYGKKCKRCGTLGHFDVACNKQLKNLNQNTDKSDTEKEVTAESKEIALTELPTECLLKHPLQHTWSVWYVANDRNQSWEENLSKIADFNSLEDFWSFYNFNKLASEIRVGCDYSLFKNGIRPMWNDEANKRGGKWVISLNKTQRNTDLDRLWLDAMLWLIGEAFEHAEDVCGAVVNIRAKGDKISIWTADGHNRQAVLEIGQKLKERLRLSTKFQIVYQLHKDSMVKTSSIVKSPYTL